MGESFTGEDIRQLFLEFCKASRVLEGAEFAKAEKLVVVLHDFLAERVQNAITGTEARTIVNYYGSDATSYLCRFPETIDSFGRKMHRDGRVNCDFLMERGLLR